MKWWKNKDNINLLEEKIIFDSNNKGYSFFEILEYTTPDDTNIQLNNSFSPIFVDFIIFSKRWIEFVNSLNSGKLSVDEISKEKTQFREFFSSNRSNILNSLSLFSQDETIFYLNKNKHFEIENLILPFIAKFYSNYGSSNSFYISKNLRNLCLSYYCSRAVDSLYRMYPADCKKLSVSKINENLKNIIKPEANLDQFYYLYRDIYNISDFLSNNYNIVKDVISIPVTATVSKTKDISNLIRDSFIPILTAKVESKDVLSQKQSVKLLVCRNEMMKKVEFNKIRVKYSNNNVKTTSVIHWIQKLPREINISMTTDIFKGVDTINNILDSLYTSSNFSKLKPSALLHTSVIKLVRKFPFDTLNDFTYTKIKSKFGLYIFHPYIVKILKSKRLKESQVKSLVKYGHFNELILLSMCTFKNKNKNIQHLIRNIIYNNQSNRRKTFGVESALSRLPHDTLSRFYVSNNSPSQFFWEENCKHFNKINSNINKTDVYISKQCDLVFSSLVSVNKSDTDSGNLFIL